MSEIRGYRNLSDQELALIDEVKILEARWNGLVDRLRVTVNIDQRQISIGATVGEDAFSRLVRAIAKPERQVIGGVTASGGVEA